MPRTESEIEFDKLIHRLNAALKNIDATSFVCGAEIMPLMGTYKHALRCAKYKDSFVCCYCNKIVKQRKLFRRFFHFCTMKTKDIEAFDAWLKKVD